MPAYCVVTDHMDRDIAVLVLTQDGKDEDALSWKLRAAAERPPVTDAVVLSIIDRAVQARLKVFNR